jgi:hypothetical protein
VTTEQIPEDQEKPGADPDRLTRLSELAAEIIDELDHLANDSGEQFVSLARRARTNRRLITAIIVSVALDVILSVFLALVTAQVVNLTDRLDTAQTIQRQKALCPLYQLFLDSQSAKGRAAAPDPVKYDHSFVVIKDGYNALGCSDFIAKSP